MHSWGGQFYHGTGEDQADGILHEGIRPSAEGSFGPGVYLAHDQGMADNYAAYGYVHAATLRGTVGFENPKVFHSNSEVLDYLNQKGVYGKRSLTTYLAEDGYDGMHLMHKGVSVGIEHGSFHPNAIRNGRDKAEPWTDLT